MIVDSKLWTFDGPFKWHMLEQPKLHQFDRVLVVYNSMFRKKTHDWAYDIEKQSPCMMK
jgi:hypothetical protein